MGSLLGFKDLGSKCFRTSIESRFRLLKVCLL